MRYIRLVHTNLALRVLASVLMIAVMDVLIIITCLPVVTCLTAVYRDQASWWLLIVAQLALGFSIYVTSYPAVGLYDLWAGKGIFQDFQESKDA